MDMNIQYLQGVGPRRAALLKSELEIETVRDLLSQYPFRYIDRTSFHRIADIVPDQAYIQIKAAVKSVKLLGKKGDTLDPSSAPKGAVNRLSAIVEDDSGEIEVVFFKGIKWMVTRLVVGRVFVFFGKPSVFNGRINLVHPEVDDPDVSAKGGLSGVYTSTEKLKNGGITGKVMAKLVASALDMVLPTLN